MTKSVVRERTLALAGLAVLSALALWSVGTGIANGLRDSIDLHTIWNAAQVFWNGQDPYATFLDYKVHGGTYPGYAPNYVPAFFVLFRPFFVFGWPAVGAGFIVLNVLLAIGTVVLLCRLFLPNLSATVIAILTCLLLTSTPLRDLLGKGQVVMLVIFCFFLAYHYQQKKRYSLAVLFLVLAMLKYNITLPLMLVFLRRNAIGSLIAAGLIHSAVIVTAAFWLEESPWHLIETMVRVNAYLINDGHVNYSNILGTFGAAGAQFGILLSAAISLLAILLMALRPPADDLLALCLLSVVSVLVVYHGSYDMVMLMIPMTYVVRTVANGNFRSSPRTVQLGIVTIGLSTALLWYIVEFADALGAATLGNHSFTDPHVVFLWYILMAALTLSLVTFFAAAFDDRAMSRG